MNVPNIFKAENVFLVCSLSSLICGVGCEFAQPKHRGTLGLISDLTYGLAYILTGLIFYLDPNWRSFQLYITLFHVFYLVYAL